MAYVGKPLSTLPEKSGAGRPWDREAANALKSLTDVAGQTGTDGETYPDSKSARAQANAAKRLLAHVVPAGTTIETRVYPQGEGFGWSVWQVKPKATETETKTEAAAPKSK